jgi:hypothetical protein
MGRHPWNELADALAVEAKGTERRAALLDQI